MQHLDLGIAEHGEQVIAAAGLAEAGVHRLLVDHGRLLAGETGRAEGVGELGLQFVHAFGRGGREIRKYLVDVHRVRQMPRAVSIGIASVDDDTRLFLEKFGEFGGSNQDFHSSLSVEVVGGLGWTVNSLFARVTPPPAFCEAAWWPA